MYRCMLVDSQFDLSSSSSVGTWRIMRRSMRAPRARCSVVGSAGFGNSRHAAAHLGSARLDSLLGSQRVFVFALLSSGGGAESCTRRRRWHSFSWREGKEDAEASLAVCSCGWSSVVALSRWSVRPLRAAAWWVVRLSAARRAAAGSIVEVARSPPSARVGPPSGGAADAAIDS